MKEIRDIAFIGGTVLDLREKLASVRPESQDPAEEISSKVRFCALLPFCACHSSKSRP